MSPIFRIIYFTRRFWPLYFFMSFFVIAVSLLSLVGPLLSKQVVDIIVAKITGQTINFSLFYQLLAIIIIVDIIISLLTSIGQWIGDILSLRLQSYLSQKFYHHILSLHVGYYDNEITGKIANKMYRGISSISEFIQEAFNNFLPFFLTAVVTVILLARYSLVISLLLFILFPIYILISHGSSISWTKTEGQKNALADLSQGRVMESLTGIRVVKSFATELLELKNFITSRHQIEILGIAQSRRWHIFDFVRRLLLNFIMFAIYAFIVYWTFNGRYTLGEMTLMIQLVNQARFPLFAMSWILGQIQQASAGSDDFFKILATPPEINDTPSAQPLLLPANFSPSQPIIEFKNITFGYEHGREVLHQISFPIFPHEKIALVAESGQGKSTIVNLLLRYYQPQNGQIFLNNQNIAEVTQESLHQQIAVVFQESLLFSGTIFENISYGCPNATKTEVITAAKAANAHDFILKLPHKYNSRVGERGVRLSGGQKQRIAIARAILKNAPIIVLDEATSSLDSKAEVLVQKGLDHLMAHKTSIIIAHRLSTIANADKILAIDNGQVVQYGSPQKLLQDKNGLYSQLISLQRQLLQGPPTSAVRSELHQFDLVG